MPILTNTAEQPEQPRRGAVWSIAEPKRELDSNLIRLPAGEEIPAHIGAEVDTLVHVVRGEGVLTTEDGEEPLRAGDVALLPRRTVRGFRAGEDGLEYLTVHRRRQSLTIKGARD
ncbi:cupin domain-containing protein [Brachybacterium paraconglomeratum]